MSKQSYNETGYNAGRGRPTEDSQSPQAHRGSAQDYEQFQKGDVQVSTESADSTVGLAFREFPGKADDGSF